MLAKAERDGKLPVVGPSAEERIVLLLWVDIEMLVETYVGVFNGCGLFKKNKVH